LNNTLVIVHGVDVSMVNESMVNEPPPLSPDFFLPPLACFNDSFLNLTASPRQVTPQALAERGKTF
jgi:hypothetical protein